MQRWRRPAVLTELLARAARRRWATRALMCEDTVERIQWYDVPGSLKEAISARTWPIVSGHAVSDGQNSPLAAIIETCKDVRR